MKLTGSKPAQQLHMYTTDKGRKIYFDPLTKDGYIIPPEKEKTLQQMNNSLLYAVLLFVFSYILFGLNIIVSAVLALSAGALLEWRFRRFLSRCSRIRNFKPQHLPQNSVSSVPDGTLMLRAALYFVITVLLILSVTLQKPENILVYGASAALASAGAVTSVRYLAVLIGRKRHL